MGRVTIPRAILAVLAVWIVGAFFLPLGGMIHFLLIVALILYGIHRLGREETFDRSGSRR